MISDDDIQKVREATDIVALFAERVQLRQRGRDIWCCCPFHNERTPSCKVDPNSQLWHCFGCGEGGDIFSFVMKRDDVSFLEAVRYLAERANVEIDEGARGGVSQGQKSRLRDVCAAAADFFHEQLMRGKSQDAAAARAYLAARGFGGDVPKQWNLGFAIGRGALVNRLSEAGFTADEMIAANVAMADSSGRLRDRFFNRVMFPICDVSGCCIAFGGRVVGDGNPKYLNSQETPIFHKSRVLYGLDKAKAQMTVTGDAVVVEGYTDVIALHKAGVKNVVATLGTALTIQHIRELSRHAGKRIIYLFDGDEAGQRAAERALQFIDYTMTPEAGKTKMEICAVTLPDGLDPAEFVEARGVDALKDLLGGARPLLIYGIERRLACHDLSSAEGRSAALMDALAVLAPIKDSVLAKDYAAQIAGRVRVSEADALAKLAAMKQPRVVGADGGGVASAGGGASGAGAGGAQAGYAAQAARNIPESELNRLRFEREFLGLAAQNPLLAISYADVMSKTDWHDREHLAIAEALLAALMENPAVSAADLVARAQKVSPHAPAILTAAASADDARAQLDYLANEIAIGDMEAFAAQLKQQVAADGGSGGSDNSGDAFSKLVETQRRLTALREKRQVL